MQIHTRCQFAEPESAGPLLMGNTRGCNWQLNQSFWISSQARKWLQMDIGHNCQNNDVLYVDVLAPTPIPEHRWPVFLTEARRDFFKKYRVFDNGDLLQFLFWSCRDNFSHLKSGRFDNLFLLRGSAVAVVHCSGSSWQLHVKEDVPYVIEQGTRIFALQWITSRGTSRAASLFISIEIFCREEGRIQNVNLPIFRKIFTFNWQKNVNWL